MIKYSLKCKKCLVEFESWFISSKEFERLKKLNFLNCESCGSLKVEKSLMSPNLANTKKKPADHNTAKFKEIKKKLKDFKKDRFSSKDQGAQVQDKLGKKMKEYININKIRFSISDHIISWFIYI